jgi:hypothetical protein
MPVQKRHAHITCGKPSFTHGEVEYLSIAPTHFCHQKFALVGGHKISYWVMICRLRLGVFSARKFIPEGHLQRSNAFLITKSDCLREYRLDSGYEIRCLVLIGCFHQVA